MVLLLEIAHNTLLFILANVNQYFLRTYFCIVFQTNILKQPWFSSIDQYRYWPIPLLPITLSHYFRCRHIVHRWWSIDQCIPQLILLQKIFSSSEPITAAYKPAGSSVSWACLRPAAAGFLLGWRRERASLSARNAELACWENTRLHSRGGIQGPVAALFTPPARLSGGQGTEALGSRSEEIATPGRCCRAGGTSTCTHK